MAPRCSCACKEPMSGNTTRAQGGAAISIPMMRGELRHLKRWGRVAPLVQSLAKHHVHTQRFLRIHLLRITIVRVVPVHWEPREMFV